MKLPPHLTQSKPSEPRTSSGAGQPDAAAAGAREGSNDAADERGMAEGSTNPGAETRKRAGRDASSPSGSGTPVGDRAHIVNKDAHAQKILAGPGSLDPRSLAAPTIPDVRRWLAKRGIELQVPEGWRFMGTNLDGRSISFNHTGTNEGHSVEVTTWLLADDTPLARFLAPYLEEADELKRLGRLGEHKTLRVGDAEGVLLVGFGPDTPEELRAADEEALFLATDGTGRRTMSWRGATERGSERHLTIASFSSPIETFFEARPVFDAMLERLRVVR